jgi:hypothetical protein
VVVVDQEEQRQAEEPLLVMEAVVQAVGSMCVTYSTETDSCRAVMC